MPHILGIGFTVEYLGGAWTVQAITKSHVVLASRDNPGRTTRIELDIFEDAVDAVGKHQAA